jgi:hypothetical protein
MVVVVVVVLQVVVVVVLLVLFVVVVLLHMLLQLLLPFLDFFPMPRALLSMHCLKPPAKQLSVYSSFAAVPPTLSPSSSQYTCNSSYPFSTMYSRTTSLIS